MKKETIDIRDIQKLHWKKQDTLIKNLANRMMFARTEGKKYFIVHNGQLPEVILRLIT